MGSTGTEVWRPLLRSLRHIAMEGAVKPTCEGVIRANSQHGAFIWKGVPPPPNPQLLFCAPLPANEIELRLSLDGDQVNCSIHINALRGRDILLSQQSGTDRLVRLVEALRELAQWI